MLEMLLAIAAIIIAISCTRIFVNEHDYVNYSKRRRGHVFFIYGARGGFTDIIADMLYRSATNEISNPDFRRWKVIHQSDYYKSYNAIIRNKSCCKTIKYEFYKGATKCEDYYEYISYDNIDAIDVELLMADVRYYIRRGINVILEGNIILNVQNDSPTIFVEYDTNNLIEICKNRSDIIPTNEKNINAIRRKIIENYVPNKWMNTSGNSAGIIGTDLITTYNSIAEHFKKIQLQINANSDDDRAYTYPSIR